MARALAPPAAPLLATLLIAGCAAVPAEQLGSGPVKHTISDDDRAISAVASVPDPLEGFNRGVYWFNADLDEKALQPVLRAYRIATPEVVRDRIGDFFSNLTEIPTTANSLLQLRPEVASRAVIRFCLNTTIGVLGLFDVAGEIGIEQQREDFGQTLGWWGVPAGAYLVLPVLGPSSARDFFGLGVDTAAGMTLEPARTVYALSHPNPAVDVAQAVDARDQVEFRYYDSGSAFEYDYVRFISTKLRELEVKR